jgi:O-antigen ligase
MNAESTPFKLLSPVVIVPGVLLTLVLVGMLAGISPAIWLMGAAGLIGSVALIYFADSVFRGDIEPLLWLWVAIFPLGYYFLSFPRQDPAISFDRLLVLCLGVACFFARANRVSHVTPELKMAASAWLLFLLASAVSLVHMDNPLGGTKLLIDAFVLPAILGYAVLQELDLRRSAPVLHFLVCFFCIYSLAVGICEAILDTDLLPLPSGIFYTALESETIIPRVNGPFRSIGSFSIIGLIACIYLCVLWRLIPRKPAWRKILHGVGLTASLGMALLPLLRSILVTMLVIVVIDALFFAKRRAARILRFSFLGAILLAGLAAQVFAPDLFENRTNPANVYQRFAQVQQTISIFFEHPLTGVGLGNFLVYAGRTNVAGGSFGDTGAANAAHNNFGEVLAETGILGAVPFLLSQIFFVMAFWKLRQGTFIWKYFLYIFLAYWINGMGISSGYEGDLNLFYILATVSLVPLALADRASMSSEAGALMEPQA